jgi:hypothetical protein
VAPLLEFFLDGLVTVELTIDYDSQGLVLIGDWLISRGQVNNAKTGVAQGSLRVWSDPRTLTVGASMAESLRSLFDDRRRDWGTNPLAPSTRLLRESRTNVARDRNFLHTHKGVLPLMQQQNGSQPRFCTTQSHRSLKVGSAKAGSWAVYDL